MDFTDADDVPLSEKLLRPNLDVKVKLEDSTPELLDTNGKPGIKEEDSSDSDVPLSMKTLSKKKKQVVKKEKTTAIKREDGAISKIKKEADLTKRKSTSSLSSTTKKLNKDGVAIKSENGGDEEEKEYQWWLENQQQNDNSVKWETLEHNGVYFPPPYEPHGVKMLYDGQPLTLPPEVEELATFFAALIDTDYARNPVFCKNFFKDFKDLIKETNTVTPTPIKEFKKCDFTPIFHYLEALKAKKKTKTKEEKLKDKAEKEKIDEYYGYAILNGNKEKLGNFRIEPPGLFRGRGDHPKTGCYKRRVLPEQVTINIGADAKIPDPPAGHKWGNVVHDNSVTWLATWKENVNGQFKYVLFGATSSLKGQSDLRKFEKARELKGVIDEIRKTYLEELRDKMLSVRQRATAMYLIDRLALRAGNEKGEDEADTVGCCSLRYEHVTLCPPNILKFDFLGKDSIRYINEVEVIDQVYKNIALFKKSPKKEGDMIFDRLNTGSLNRHLNSLLPGLSAKVFRTYNASFTFQNELKNTPADGSIHEKILAYNRANRQVAILCNHQRSVSKGFESQMERIDEKLNGLLYQRYRLKLQALKLDPKAGKTYPQLLEKDENIDEFWSTEFVNQLMEKEKEKIKTKFEKTNLALKERNEEPQPDSILKSKLAELDLEKKQLLKEIKTGKVTEPTKVNSLDKIIDKIEKLNTRIDITKTSKIDKDENKTTALGTSKINYIDPRISFAWCKKYDVPIDKIFNKTLREKFKWASEPGEDFEF